ncbi:outer membrane beta-barrel protein [Acidobacteriota bacterium]
MNTKKFFVALTVLLMIAGMTHGTEKENIGLNFRVDPNPRVGITFHITSKLALRPYVGFSWMETEVENERAPLPPGSQGQQNRPRPPQSVNTKASSTDLLFGLSLLYYFHQSDDFAVYTGANFGYRNLTGETEISARDQDSERSQNTYNAGILLGTQFNLSRHFAIFGEIGFGYSTGASELDNRGERSSNTKRWGLMNTGIGLTFYF